MLSQLLCHNLLLLLNLVAEASGQSDDEDFFASGPKEALKRLWELRGMQFLISKKLPRLSPRFLFSF